MDWLTCVLASLGIMARSSTCFGILARPSTENRRSSVRSVDTSSVGELVSYRCDRRRVSVVGCLALLAATFAFFGLDHGKEAHAGVGYAEDGADVAWGRAPDWPFEGVVAHKGGEFGHLPWTIPSYVSRHGLQFVDVKNESLTFVELIDDFDAGHFACASTSMRWSDAGLTWTLLYGSAYARRWYVPWGDYAYPLFSSDLSHYSIRSRSNTQVGDMTTAENEVFVGLLGARFTVWSRTADEPACAATRHDLAVRSSGESQACGFSWSPIHLITSTATTRDHLDWVPMSPYHATDDENCGTLDLKQWQEAIAGTSDG